jgi:hypothetical protein
MAISIAAVAGFFSVTGMTTLFAAAFWPVVIMMLVLESGKLVTAGWLHANWRNPRVSWLHKGYLSLAIVALMLITAVGIYGFLAKGFLDQKVPAASLSLQIAERERQLTVARDNIAALNARQTQLDAAVNSLIQQNYVIRSQALRREQRPEREQIANDIHALQQSIKQQSDELVPLQTAANDVEAKLGPIQYLADLFGWTHTDVAVRSVILILMFAFDPLAIALVISASISITEWLEQPRPSKPVEPLIAPVQEHSDQPIEPIIIERLENVPVSEQKLAELLNKFDPETHRHKPMLDDTPVGRETGADEVTDRQTVLAILRRNPGVVEDVIDTVIEWHEQHH